MLLWHVFLPDQILLLFGPFTLSIFAAISAVISNRTCKLLAVLQRFESPVVYTGDQLKSP